MNAKGLNPFDEWKLLRRFKQELKQQKPDVALSYTIKNNTFGALAAKSLGLPIVPCEFGLGTGYLSVGTLRFIVEQLFRRSYRGLPAGFFQNEDDRDLFPSRRLVTTDQARLLPGSVTDLGHFQASVLSRNDAPVFLLIAQLLRDKGVIEFVKAALQIKAERPKVRFQLLDAAGSANRTAISADTDKGWVKDGIVEYLGITSCVPPIIAALTCVVLPYYREAAPRTLIEAAATARPAVATDVPGCRMVVDHEANGFLCIAQDAGSLAAAIRRFLDLSPDQQGDRGRAGRAKMEHEYH